MPRVASLMRVLAFLSMTLVVGGLPTTSARVPSDLERWLVGRVGDDVEHVEVESTRLPWVDNELVTIKFFRVSTNTIEQIVLDADGRELPDRGRALLHQDFERRFELVGSLSDELLEQLLITDTESAIPIAVWLRIYNPNEIPSALSCLQADLRSNADHLSLGA